MSTAILSTKEATKYCSLAFFTTSAQLFPSKLIGHYPLSVQVLSLRYTPVRNIAHGSHQVIILSQNPIRRHISAVSSSTLTIAAHTHSKLNQEHIYVCSNPPPPHLHSLFHAKNCSALISVDDSTGLTSYDLIQSDTLLFGPILFPASASSLPR